MSEPIVTVDSLAVVARTYARAADKYDEFAEVYRQIGQRLLDRLPLLATTPGVILDLGCGSGSTLPLLRKRYSRSLVIGLDLVPAMLDKARPRTGRWRKASLIAADAARLPFQNDSVDLVISNMVFPWCQRPDQVLAEIHRILSPGGTLLFTTAGPDTLQEYRHLCQHLDTHKSTPIQDTHNSRPVQDTHNFQRPVRDTHNLGSVQDSLGSGPVRDSPGSGSDRDSPGSGPVRDSPGSGSVRDSSGSGPNRDSHESRAEPGSFVFGLTDMHDLGDAMLAAGFDAPVLDRENLTISYPTVAALEDELRNTGTVNVSLQRRRGLMHPSVRAARRLGGAAAAVSGGGGDRFCVTVELVQGHAWKGQIPGGQRSPDGEYRISVDSIRRRLDGVGSGG